jgi:ribosome-associated protein
MDIRKLQRAIVDGLEDVKAHNIAVFNTEALSPLFERVIIASGTSNRQTKALASSVRDKVKARGMQVLRTEGEATGEWIIVDCGAAVAHIMQPAIREYYHLEEIWGGKPVRLKSADLAPGLPKAGAASAPGKTSGARRGTGAGSAAQGAKGRKAASTPESGQGTATRSAAPKTASAKKAVTAKRPPAAKPAARKQPAKTAAAKNATAARPAAPKRRA